MDRRRDDVKPLAMLLTVLLLVACGEVASTPTPEPVAAAAFDLALVMSNLTDECVDPIAVDDQFCEQVDIDGMTADGTTLIVPTTLNAGATDRASAICDQFLHFDGETGDPLGYDTIGVLDRDGGNAAACSIQ